MSIHRKRYNRQWNKYLRYLLIWVLIINETIAPEPRSFQNNELEDFYDCKAQFEQFLTCKNKLAKYLICLIWFPVKTMGNQDCSHFDDFIIKFPTFITNKTDTKYRIIFSISIEENIKYLWENIFLIVLVFFLICFLVKCLNKNGMFLTFFLSKLKQNRQND